MDTIASNHALNVSQCKRERADFQGRYLIALKKSGTTSQNATRGRRNRRDAKRGRRIHNEQPDIPRLYDLSVLPAGPDTPMIEYDDLIKKATRAIALYEGYDESDSFDLDNVEEIVGLLRTMIEIATYYNDKEGEWPTR